MENKRGSLSTVFLVIAIILIIVMGALLYMQKTEADRQIAELKSNASELQEAINKLQDKNDLTSNTIDSKDIYEICEKKFSNVEYRRETGGSSGFFIKAGVLYSGEENLTETHSKTTGVEGKAKYVVPVNKQTDIAVVLTENGKLFINKELSNDFSSILEEHKILEIINIPNEDGHLLLASDGKILKLDGTLYLDLLKEDNNSGSEDVDNIVLDGSYVIDASDLGYKFSANGDVVFSSNTVELKGRYTTVSENEIQINFTQKEVWNDMTNEVSTENVNKTEKVIVVDKTTLTVTGEDEGNKYNYTLKKF